MGFVQLKIEAFIKAPVSRVWLCWTHPGHIIRWNFASEDWCCPSAHVDLRQGGDYCARMESRDGNMGFDLRGKYGEVAHEERVVLILEDGRQALTRFESTPAGTRVETVFDAETQNPPELQQQGWQAILNQFKFYVEQTE